LTDTLSPDTVIDTVISSASAVSDATAVAIFLYGDETHTTLSQVRSAGFPDALAAELPEPLMITLNDQPIGAQPPVVIENAVIDPRAEPLRAVMERAGKRAWVEMPLVYQGVGLGVLISYYDEPHSFSR